MSVQLDHTIIPARQAEHSAKFWTDVLGLPAPERFGPFIVVKTANAVSLDFRTTQGEILSRHFAFLVSESDFDAIFNRIITRKIDFWADPGRTMPQEINHHDHGRGCYFLDPDGHLLEIITKSYGAQGST